MNNQVELLKGLNEAEAAETLALGSRLTVMSGDVLFALGAPATHLYIVERGRLRLTLPMQVGGREEDVLVEERRSGEMLGWSALIPPYRFTLKATALIETGVIAIPADALRRHFADRPAVGAAISLNLAVVIGQRLQVFQAMWLREMQRMIEARCAVGAAR